MDRERAHREFRTTRWSLVRAAASADEPQARRALSELCELYWPAVYAYARRRGLDAASAEDLTQTLFARLLERDQLAGVDEQRGRFRAWLRAAVEHQWAGDRERAAALKRGGGHALVSLDRAAAERVVGASGASGDDPARAFDRAWVHTLLGNVLEELAAEYAERGRAPLFEALRPTLDGSGEAPPLAELAARLGTTHGAVKVAVHRLRNAFGQRLRRAVAETVANAGDVEDELDELFRSAGP